MQIGTSSPKNAEDDDESEWDSDATSTTEETQQSERDESECGVFKDDDWSKIGVCEVEEASGEWRRCALYSWKRSTTKPGVW